MVVPVLDGRLAKTKALEADPDSVTWLSTRDGLMWRHHARPWWVHLCLNGCCDAGKRFMPDMCVGAAAHACTQLHGSDMALAQAAQGFVGIVHPLIPACTCMHCAENNVITQSGVLLCLYEVQGVH